ncbi:TonB-dependent receptor plug domain-containing protein [Tropicimonas sp.]|uniref:TonB-dependent receptor plug domain-containing protein n=1 Tax=Tropicimonas sp. TaxID=2067044 RepID=UPI003A8A6EF6
MLCSTSRLRRLIFAGTILSGIPVLPVLAQTAEQGGTDAFELGTIYVDGNGEGQGGTTTTVSGEQAMKAGRVTLDDTVGVLPGVSSISGGGSRNEREVFVRGFDRWHVPLSIDGIRIYLPADNRLDFGRFLTPDLAEIQIQKSYVSVLNGPGGMGGAINLVTRKPTEPFEGELQLGIEAGNSGDVTGRQGYIWLGTKQEFWYAQLSYMKRESDGFYLSDDFDAVPQENGKLRDDSDSEDSRLNVKLGYTPNATDEYVLSYTRQEGAKNAPYSVLLPISGKPDTYDPDLRDQRNWTWPEWDVSSLAFYSHTELPVGYLKTRFYYNTFDNTLSSWDDYHHNTQTSRRTFDSVYEDYSLGASAEYGVSLGAHDLKTALHFRRDIHQSTQHSMPDLVSGTDPTEHSEEETIAVAVEDSWQISDAVRLVGGLSYSRAMVLEANRTRNDRGLPKVETEAVDWQLAAIWTPEMWGEFHASVSSRTSFPTLFHRYSTRFGTFEVNPDLDAERATNFEIGYRGDIGPVAVEGALFYSDVTDLIQSVYRYTDSFGDEIWQQQNVGDGIYKGVELAANWAVNDRVDVYANYTYLDASISDPSINGLRVTDIPQHKFYLGADWQATDTLTLSPSIEAYGSRWSDPAVNSGDAENPTYTKMSEFALANFAGTWQATPRIAVDFGVRNLLDHNYELVEGYPEPGRSFFLTSQVKF